MNFSDILPTQNNISKKNYKENVKNYFTGKFWEIFRGAMIIALCYILVYPLLYMISMSFRDLQDMYDVSVKWVPKTYTLDNITRVWEAMDYTTVLGNSIILSFTSAVASVITCALAGYGLARFKFKFQGVLLGLMFFMIIVPPQFFALSSYLNFRYTDFLFIIRLINLVPGVGIEYPSLLGSKLTIILPAVFGAGVRSGLYIYIFRQFFKGMPKELEEASYIDGCGYLKTFVRIMAPSAIPAITTCFLFAFVWNWNEYYLTGMFLEGASTLSSALVVLQNIIYQSEVTGGIVYTDLNRLVLDMQSGALLVVAPVLVVYLIFQRLFVESIERTGLVE